MNLKQFASAIRNHWADNPDAVFDPCSRVFVYDVSDIEDIKDADLYVDLEDCELDCSSSKPLNSLSAFRVGDSLVLCSFDYWQSFEKVFTAIRNTTDTGVLGTYKFSSYAEFADALEDAAALGVRRVLIFHPVFTHTASVQLPLRSGSQEWPYAEYCSAAGGVDTPYPADLRALGYTDRDFDYRVGYMVCPVNFELGREIDDLTDGSQIQNALEMPWYRGVSTDCMAAPVRCFEDIESFGSDSDQCRDELREAAEQLARQFIVMILAQETVHPRFEDARKACRNEDISFTESVMHDADTFSGYHFLERVYGDDTPVFRNPYDLLGEYCFLICTAAHALLPQGREHRDEYAFRIAGYYRPWLGWGFRPLGGEPLADEPLTDPSKCLGTVQNRSHAPYTAEEE